MADLGFDSSGDPDETLEETEARQAEGLGILHGEVGTPEYWRAMTKLEQAAELKVPAALAVDSVRFSIADADARSRWATSISAPILAGAFAVAWEWENTALISELVEYHSARGTFDTDPQRPAIGEWASTGTATVLVDTGPEPATALAAAGPPAGARRSLTRLGPLPPLQMQPDSPAIMSHYRALALAALRPRRHRCRTRLVDLAMSEADRLTLVLRYADVGIVTYASLRIVGQPSRTVTWLVEEPILLAATEELTDAIPEPHGDPRAGATPSSGPWPPALSRHRTPNSRSPTSWACC